jgi:NADH-quinone oxidoreductase subunit L
MLKLVWLIPVLPLIGFLLNFLLGRKLGLRERTISLIACGVILASMLLTFGAFYDYHWSYNPANEDKPYVTTNDGFPNSFTWLPGGAARNTHGQKAGALSNFNIEWSYQIDQLAGDDVHRHLRGILDTRFRRRLHARRSRILSVLRHLNLFMFMMLLLVMGSNFMIMFIGWEGVGLCSYLLIGYYFNKQEAATPQEGVRSQPHRRFGMVLAIAGVFATLGLFNSAKSLKPRLLIRPKALAIR